MRLAAWLGRSTTRPEGIMIGAVDQIEIGHGVTADLYLLRFDKDGNLKSPRTAEKFLEAAAGASDVFCFSHGWNNTYELALANYRRFIQGFAEQRRQLNLPMPAGYKPVLLGIIWPATSFVLPWEAGPEIAGAGDPAQSLADEEMLTFVSESLSAADEATLAELIDGRTELPKADAERAATIVLSALWADEDPDAAVPPPSAPEFLDSWQAIDEATTGDVSIGGEDDFHAVTDDDAGPDAGGAPDSRPQAAGGFSLDPRNLLRGATLWKMKARAGRVGANGVGPIIHTVLTQSATTRVHLIGHSFGARVMLSAVASGPFPSTEFPRKVFSMLLLQPAVNRWCFAPKVIGTDAVGGYNPVLDRVVKPILTTFSASDVPLHDFFHLAVRSVGELEIAAIGDTDRFGALGGYGPAGLGQLVTTVPAIAPGTKNYDLTNGFRVVAIDGGVVLAGATAIAGHSEINNPVTYWALHNAAAPET
ncbi:MAG: hypothetical protein ACOH2F_04925 [Cellulomonas sp.]